MQQIPLSASENRWFTLRFFNFYHLIQGLPAYFAETRSGSPNSQSIQSPHFLLQRKGWGRQRRKLATMNADALILAADSALRTLLAEPRASRPPPSPTIPGAPLGEPDRRESAALMRVNHVGEVCAQALYTGQMLASRDPALQSKLAEASREETDHLAWTLQRLRELNDRPSLLNPLWYAGAFAIGFAAGKLGGDRLSLGFVVETENQVEAHLNSHMERLPAGDAASRAIVAQMKNDEVAHARMAERAGAVALPGPVKGLMKIAAKVMTTVAHRV